jgi:hypothetical protein
MHSRLKVSGKEESRRILSAFENHCGSSFQLGCLPPPSACHGGDQSIESFQEVSGGQNVVLTIEVYDFETVTFMFVAV